MSGSGSLFASVIEDHLALKRRNGHLDERMPIDDFIVDDPFENHPLFKSEDEARREEEETGEHPAVALEIPADTLTIQLPAAVEEHEPRGWMETTTDQDFRWE
ncbi:MAG TPA: hypothetical protein VE824_02440 [Gaiellales bacterium]|nr:hypothetical protein [Gaiellales bacterium]